MPPPPPPATRSALADRRMDEGDLHVVGEDDREMHGIDAERTEGRSKDRQDEKKGRRDLEETPENEQQEIDRQEELPSLEVIIEGELDQFRWHARLGHPVAERQGGGDDDHDRRRAFDAIGDDGEGFLPLEAAIAEEADD